MQRAQAIQRGFATTSIAKKKDDTADKAAAVEAAEPAATIAVKDLTQPVAQGSHNETSASTNGVAQNGLNAGLSEWDAREEVRKREEHEEMLDRIKNSSEKEATKVMKVLDYEKRVSSSYQEFYWDDPKDLVCLWLICIASDSHLSAVRSRDRPWATRSKHHSDDRT